MTDARGSFLPWAIVRLGRARAWAALRARVAPLWAEPRELGRGLEIGFFNF